MKYLLDSNSIIDAYTRCYQFSFCPAFWDFLEQEAFCSIENVYDEIKEGREKEEKEGDTKFYNWLDKQKEKNFFLPIADNKTQNYNRDIVNFVNDKYDRTNKSVKNFLEDKSADTWLIAKAKAQNLRVITEEVSTNDQNQVKIPNVCKKFKVECSSIFELLAKLKPQFILKNPKKLENKNDVRTLH